MWIKKQKYPLQYSWSSHLNFLYQSGNVYIMDNHLAAAWCWINQLDTGKSYNLYHIDNHYDLQGDAQSVKSQIIDVGFDLQNCSLDAYLNLKQPMPEGESAALFRYDTYILNLQQVYTGLFARKYFATQRIGNRKEMFIDPGKGDCEKEIFQLISQMADDIDGTNDNQWIVNLDLDYFFIEKGEEHFQHLTDDYIVALCENIKRSIKKIAVVTIALSPEFCGGWKKSYRIAKLVSRCLELDFELKV
ncbi:MAG: hypothetical protein JEZ14_07720 [Marinilabiliaceae bacterium]|nr:hypothetical protein [Marinilabiliaceae bacterium]